MAAGIVRDKVAAKILALSTATRTISVYSNAASNTALAPWPPETPDIGSIHALVRRGASVREGGTGNQRMNRAIDAEFRFSAMDQAQAQRQIDSLDDELLTAFSSGVMLDVTVIDCTYLGSDAPFELIDDQERRWIVWIAHFMARERLAVEMTA